MRPPAPCVLRCIVRFAVAPAAIVLVRDGWMTQRFVGAALAHGQWLLPNFFQSALRERAALPGDGIVHSCSSLLNIWSPVRPTTSTHEGRGHRRLPGHPCAVGHFWHFFSFDRTVELSERTEARSPGEHRDPRLEAHEGSHLLDSLSTLRRVSGMWLSKKRRLTADRWKPLLWAHHCGVTLTSASTREIEMSPFCNLCVLRCRCGPRIRRCTGTNSPGSGGQ